MTGETFVNQYHDINKSIPNSFKKEWPGLNMFCRHLSNTFIVDFTHIVQNDLTNYYILESDIRILLIILCELIIHQMLAD